MDRVFLDANVLFSASHRSQSGVLWLWERKGIQLLTSEYAIEEARRNLAGADCQQRLARRIASLEVVSTPPPSLIIERTVEVVSIPPPSHTIETWLGVRLPGKDQPILAAAIDAAATHLLTGDKKHFGSHFGRRIRGVLIQTPAQYRLSKSRGRRGT